MATERSLGALLRSLQSPSDTQDGLKVTSPISPHLGPRMRPLTSLFTSLLPTATSLLAVLKNPLNITLLASQLLTSPAIWNQAVDLHTCRRIISVFNTAAMAILQSEESEDPRIPWGGPGPKKLDREEWVKAVVSGADEKSPRWRHLLLIGGVLLGFEGQDRQGLPWNVRKKLEAALVTAAQLALEELDPHDGVDGRCVTMVLNYSFELLSDLERSRLDYDRLLPVMVQTVYLSPEGFEGAYFLGSVDQDIVQMPSKQFAWPPQSTTVQRVMAISSSPLISALGPLSRLIAHAVENVRDPRLVARSVDQLADFVRTLAVQWRQNKLSEVDKAEEVEFLEPNSLRETIPSLWKLLRNCLYSAVIILRAVFGRVINDRGLASDKSENPMSLNINSIC